MAEQLSEACTFCRIVGGDLAATVVHEDDRTIAFLDHRPLFRGHTLLIPKIHVVRMSDLPAERVTDFFHRAQSLERAIESATSSDGSLVLLNNVVSQSVPHMHLHVIPRNRKDGLRFWLGPRVKYTPEDPVEAYADRIRAALAAL